MVSAHNINCLDISWWKEESCIFENVTLKKGQLFEVNLSSHEKHKMVLVNFLNWNVVPVLPENFFRVFPNLEILDVHNSEMSEIGENTFESAGRLEHLSFSDNKLKKLPEKAFLGATLLEKIGLERNRIQKIEPEAFVGLQNLNTLNLQDNLIVKLSTFIFRPLCKLEDLNLSKNRIEIIYSKDISCNKKLRILNLEGNRLQKVDPMIFCVGEHYEQLIFLNNSCLSEQCDLIYLRLGQCFNNFFLDETKQSKVEYYPCLKRMLDKHYISSHDQLFTKNKSVVRTMWKKIKEIF